VGSDFSTPTKFDLAHFLFRTQNGPFQLLSTSFAPSSPFFSLLPFLLPSFIFLYIDTLMNTNGSTPPMAPPSTLSPMPTTSSPRSDFRNATIENHWVRQTPTTDWSSQIRLVVTVTQLSILFSSCHLLRYALSQYDRMIHQRK
jgi:hypothetical protein